jgi:hypothetical protein
MADGTSHQARGNMSKVYIVNRVISGMYPGLNSEYYSRSEEAAEAFEKFKEDVGDDPELIEIVELDTVSLTASTITGWEGTAEDITFPVDEEEEADYIGEDEDWIVEGKP